MKTINRKEKIAKTEKKLLKLRSKLEERLQKTDLAMVKAKKIRSEIEKIRNSK